jgi:hypothetical protein
MCSACEGAEIEPFEAVDRALVARARKLEAAMPGERVPEAAWAIVFDYAGGAIEWRHYQRIHQSYEDARRSAAAAAAITGRKSRRGPAVPVCERVGS